MTRTATKTYHVTVFERALATYEVEAEDARNAAENWQDGECIGHDDEALDSEGPRSVRERQPDGAWRKLPEVQWQSETLTSDPVRQAYSVLLFYPDYLNDSGTQCYYAFVEAADPIDAVTVAKLQAVAATESVEEPDDFAPLLVTEGHHRCQPLFDV
jgi:hypothetical protein